MSEVKTISPYKLTQELEERAGRLVRPQMIYSYVRSGKIPAFKDENGKWRVKVDDAEKFMKGYLERNVNVEAK